MPDKFNITKKSPLEEQIKKAAIADRRVNLLLFIILPPKMMVATRFGGYILPTGSCLSACGLYRR